MPRPAAEILEEARQLPTHMQRWLAQELLDENEDEPADAVEAAWDEEIKRRLDEIDSGKAELLPGELVIERMFAKIADHRNLR